MRGQSGLNAIDITRFPAAPQVPLHSVGRSRLIVGSAHASQVALFYCNSFASGDAGGLAPIPLPQPHENLFAVLFAPVLPVSSVNCLQ